MSACNLFMLICILFILTYILRDKHVYMQLIHGVRLLVYVYMHLIYFGRRAKYVEIQLKFFIASHNKKN